VFEFVHGLFIMHNFGSKLHKLSFFIYLCNSDDHDFNLRAKSHLEASHSFYWELGNVFWVHIPLQNQELTSSLPLIPFDKPKDASKKIYIQSCIRRIFHDPCINSKTRYWYWQNSYKIHLTIHNYINNDQNRS